MIELVQTNWTQDREAIAGIRRLVFIEEQGVPEELEWDGLDADAIHLLARDSGRPVACARMLKDGHIGRMSVLKEYRRQGIGTRMIQRLVDLGREQSLAQVYLDAQVHATAFYERLGFQVMGNEFMDAGIPHRHMHQKL
ncbi:MAG: GNAT family N-acetyltransferase [Gammaproteobacteria bacterium]|nr:GNAT family N-acetyltransferase [Gammaproteobacteria bacterium]